MKKTIAVASLALSTSLILAACGSDSEEATSSPTETSQEVEGTEGADTAPTTPLELDPEDLPDRVTPKESENGGVEAPTASDDGAVQISLTDNSVQVNYAPWFLECTDDPSADTLEELFSPDQSKFETLVIDYDDSYLDIPTVSEASGASELPEAIDVDDLEDTPTATGDVPFRTAVVLNDSDGLESIGGLVLDPQQAGTTELRVAYSCPTSGDSFDETWTLEIS